jgi:hypothetical protein
MLPRLFARCVLIIGCVCFNSLALSNTLTNITYPDGVGITGCVDSSCPSELIVPEMIDGKTVTRIEEDAFCQWYPDNYSNPDSIILPNTIKHIGESAFCDLDSIVIPASVISIYDAFDEIANIYIIKPADQNLNVYDFPVDANLYACDGLSEEGNPLNCEEAYPDIARNVLDDDSAEVFIDANGHVEIPDSYSWFDEDAVFSGNVNSFTIPNSVIYIGEESFKGFAGDIYIIKPAEQNLNVFHFPTSANLFACDGHDASGNLVNCNEAYPGVVRNAVDQDSAIAFVDINGHIEIPNTYTMINESLPAFDGINSISIPDSIMHIGEDVLEKNTFDSLIIPSSVVSFTDDSYLDVVGDIYIIKPANQYIDPYHLPHTSSHFVCESVDGSGNPIGCEDLWQSTTSGDQSGNQYAILDIDQNGSFDALTDGLILLRYAFGLRGDSLINGVVDTNANRTSASDIEVYIQTLVP